MYKIGDIVDSEKERNERLSRKSNGRFASGVFWIVVDDHVGLSWNKSNEDTPDNPEDELMSIPRICGDIVFDHIKDYNLVPNPCNAENSAKGYNLRYLQTNKATKEWFRIRHKEGYLSNFLETGSNTPVRVKAITIPYDALAEQCKNYSEYKMKCGLKGIEPSLSEEDFLIYKY
jgi:hypothetical protein